MNIKLRPATLDDVDILQKWDEQPHVIAAGGGDDFVDYEHEIKANAVWQDIWIAELSGRSIGVIFSIDPAKEESHYWGKIGTGYRALDIWIGNIKDIGKGYGSLMMRQATNICFSDPDVHTIIIDPLQTNTKAIRFYKRIGFVFVENRQFGDDNCAVYQMTR